MTTNTDADVTLGELKERIAVFAKVRDWGQFHAPKNLAMALASEVGELMEHFLWLDIAESRHLCEDAAKRAQVAEELADVLIYALRFADVTGLDATKAILAKMERNEECYPVRKAKGSSAKYNEL
ncbi:MAG: nucleotide pyrophosphohydrolase [Opitutales bacterium]